MDTEPPPPGTKVGGYRLEARLGRGGQGTVYRAGRGGRRRAIKFLSLASPDWAWRELEVRLRLRRVGELAVESHGLWPPGLPRYLYLVTPYVRGRSVYDWARWKNPTARQVVELVLEVARQLVEVHRAGVVHRDIKGGNVLVRHGDGMPVLVDFGVSTYVGAPEITNPLGIPGTRHYRSPEALRFRREHAGEHSPARASDDLWALGVLLYWLLTGGYPFDTEVADEAALADVILTREPEPPHVCNPRVPRVLGELCLRMLAKQAEARFPDAEALRAALKAVLAEADASWDVALCEAWGPDAATTLQEMGGDLGMWRVRARRLLAYSRRHARRGLPVPPEEASTLERTPEAAPPGAGSATAGERPVPPPSRTWTPLRLMLAGAVLVLGLVGLLVLLRSPSGSPSEVGSSMTSEVISGRTMPEVTKSGQEVASTSKPPEGERGAAPSQATTSAPVASATSRKEGTRVRTPNQVPTHRREKKQQRNTVLDASGKTCILVWVAGQFACASPQAQVIPTGMGNPPPASCPAGSEETMKQLGIGIGAHESVTFFIDGEPIFRKYPTVRPGQQVSLTMGRSYGKLPAHTLYIGTLLFGEGRVYGRFTQAQTPQGWTYTVCFEIYGDPTKPEENGVEMEPGSGPDAAKIFSTVELRAVRRFE
ncbi:serine/threonine protein kinase [Archangium lipolyticum]|uniref:serine/threonine protein kinase n=1 Tax=Archangium lipolyticum TaxID=2970465 RepID=UPI002149C82A|nr:serine/threonine protein kinase [Archangium lipolyticum]